MQKHLFRLFFHDLVVLARSGSDARYASTMCEVKLANEVKVDCYDLPPNSWSDRNVVAFATYLTGAVFYRTLRLWQQS